MVAGKHAELLEPIGKDALGVGRRAVERRLQDPGREHHTIEVTVLGVGDLDRQVHLLQVGRQHEVIDGELAAAAVAGGRAGILHGQVQGEGAARPRCASKLQLTVQQVGQLTADGQRLQLSVAITLAPAK